MCVFFISERGSLSAVSGKNYDEEPGSTLDRCPQRAERNFPCKPKTFQLRWLGGGGRSGRKRGCKSEQDGGKGYPASWGLGASLSYSVEGERLWGGRTLSPVQASWVSKAPLGSSLAFQLQALRMRPALGPRPSAGTGLEPCGSSRLPLLPRGKARVRGGALSPPGGLQR